MNKLKIDRKIKRKVKEIIAEVICQQIFKNKNFRFTIHHINLTAEKSTGRVLSYIDKNYTKFYHRDYK